ncbi:NTPase [Persephonella sp.]
MKILIAGRPGIGKTTVLKKVIQKIPNNVCGFYTEDYRDSKGNRKGFRIFTTEGKTEILADKELVSKYRVGSYGVNLEVFERSVIPLLERCLEDKNRIIVIDEIGKMELFSDKFVEVVKNIFEDENRTVIATIPVKDVHPVLRWIKDLPDSVVININLRNRDLIPDRIVEMVQRSSSQRFDKS